MSMTFISLSFLYFFNYPSLDDWSKSNIIIKIHIVVYLSIYYLEYQSIATHFLKYFGKLIQMVTDRSVKRI